MSAATQRPDRPKLPGIPEIYLQVRSDLFGKDVQETPTVSYTWIADQFGHFALGFEITIVLGWILRWSGYEKPIYRIGAGVAVLLFFVVKEFFDYLRERTRSAEANHIFPFNKKEIFSNIVTALFYIFFGVAVAVAEAFGPWWWFLVLVILTLIAVVVAYSWLVAKITFQQAGLPYLYRLANFPNPVGGKEIVDNIVALSRPERKDQPKHLIITGPLRAGKTSLAVAVGTEFAFHRGIGRYTSLFKLIETIERRDRRGDIPDQPEFKDGRTLWPWETSDLLIVDDVAYVIEVGKPLADAKAAPVDPVAQVEAVIRQRIDGLVDRLNLKDRRTVWVLSDSVPSPSWKTMLARILKVAENDILLVELASPIPARKGG